MRAASFKHPLCRSTWMTVCMYIGYIIMHLGG